jgi:protein SCO1/2
MKMGQGFLALALLVPATLAAAAGESHAAQGVLLKADPASRTIEVSCDAIPGYMNAMVMTFAVHDTEVLKTLQPGGTVRFTMVEEGNEEFANHLEAIKVQNYEADPTEASRLAYLHRALDPTAAQKLIPIGGLVPNFALTDQSNRLTELDDFKGMVVVLSFAYSRCPNPNYCFRLSNNLAQLSRRFQARTGRSLILLTVVIEPDHDQGDELRRYADTWKADWAVWRFLTGPLSDIRAIAERFDMDFWNNEGYLTHSFHTVVIDRDGRLAANLEGNQFTAEQLGDLVKTVLDRPASNRGGFEY